MKEIPSSILSYNLGLKICRKYLDQYRCTPLHYLCGDVQEECYQRFSNLVSEPIHSNLELYFK